MTSVVTSAGSPLDEYFKDEGKSLGSSLETKSKDSGEIDATDEGDVTLVSPDNSPHLSRILLSTTTPEDLSRKGWTGVIDSVAGPSRAQSPILPGHFDPSSVGQLRIEDEFAERFKYIICSSGILEKDYVPGLAGSGDDLEAPTLVDEELQIGHPRLRRRDTLHKLRWTAELTKALFSVACEKWDLSLAGGLLLVGLGWVSGIATIIWFFLVIGSGWGIKVFSEMLAERAMSRDTSRSGVTAAVSSLLATSRQIDTTFDESISFLSSSLDESRHHKLRLALHRATTSLVDHFASATSGLSTLINHSELVVLAEMYDVPVGPATRTRPTHLESDDEEHHHSPRNLNVSTDSEATLLSSSSRLRMKKAARSRYVSTSMSVSQSSPGRIKQNHMRHLSLASSATLPRLRSSPASPMNWTPRDRFTSLPPRTPRESRRISLDPAMWDRIRRESDEADADDNEDEPISPSRSLARIPGIPEVDGSIDTAQVLPTAEEDQPEDPDDFLSEPTSPSNAHRYSPFRTSPLATRSSSPRSDLTSPILPGISAQLLPSRSRYSLPVTTTESKRRSLQNIPYYSDDQRSPTKSIARLQNQPSSELQELRTRSSGGFRRSLSNSGPRTAPISLRANRHVKHSPVPSPSRHRRTISDNPLSLTSLKSSCLAVHLKRRRLACCLLGLRFTERQPGYWEEVCEIMRSLCSAAGSEMDTLCAAIEAAKQSGSGQPDVKEAEPVLLFPGQGNRSLGHADFAPRQAPEDALLERVEAIRDQLATLWGEVDDLRTRLQSGDDLGDRWTTLRESLREITREWEKGRGVASLLEQQDGPSRTTPPVENLSEIAPVPKVPPIERADNMDMPDFLRSWSNGSSSSSNHPEDANTTPPTGSDDDPELPLPGIDQVFESDLSALPLRETSRMTREERIKLLKEARAKGLNVNQILRAAQNEDGENTADGRIEQHEAVIKGGEVVEELKGMIGMIRRRKGLDISTDAPPERQSPGATTQYSSFGVSRPDLADDVPAVIPLGPALPDPPVAKIELEDLALSAPPSNILFPSENLRKAFVFPAVERRLSQ